jgi:hypothetical protein
MTVGRIPSVEGGIQPTIFDAKADLLTATAADTPARLAVGANDTVLTADSSTATGLKWAAPAAGGYTLLTSGSHSGTTLSVTSIPGTYKELVMFFDGYDPTNDGDALQMRFNQDAGANRHYSQLINNYVDTQAFNATLINISRGNDNTVTTNNTIVRVPNYATTAGWKLCEVNSITVSETTTTSMRAQRLMGFYNQTTAISSFDFYTESANTFAVNYKIYGVA